MAQSSTLSKKLKVFYFFFHQMFLWTHETENLKNPPNFSWEKAEVYFFKCQKVEKNCQFFEKKVWKRSYGQVYWSFDTTAEKIWEKANIFCPMSQNDKKQIFPKFYFLKKPCSGHIECSFDNPDELFEETSKGFVQSPTSTKQKESETIFSEKK